MSYTVNYLKDTKEVIDAIINGEDKFKIRIDEANEVLSKYGLNIDDERLKYLFENGTYIEWFNYANSNNELNKKVSKYLHSFVEKMYALKTKNIYLYRKMIKIFNDNENMSNEEIEQFKFPELKYYDDRLEIS